VAGLVADHHSVALVEAALGGPHARGLVRYEAEDARKICGLKSEAIEAVLGYTSGPLVHADDLALAAQAGV
jgi:glutamate 5-kinase